MNDVSPPPIPGPQPIYTPAGFWIRLVATIIDVIVLTIIVTPLLLAIYDMSELQDPAIMMDPWYFVLNVVFPAILTIVLWITVRGTPGKLICGLRVVDARTGGRLDPLQAVIRYFGYLVSMIPFCFGFLWIAFDSRKQAFHDKLARTLVVKKTARFAAVPPPPPAPLPIT